MSKLIVVLALLVTSTVTTSTGSCGCEKVDASEKTWWGHIANAGAEELPLKRIQGKVVAPNEEPVEGALFEVFTNDGSTGTPTSQKEQRVAACRVGEKGKFCFDGLKPGKYILAIGRQAFNITFFSVTLDP